MLGFSDGWKEGSISCQFQRCVGQLRQQKIVGGLGVQEGSLDVFLEVSESSLIAENMRSETVSLIYSQVNEVTRSRK